MNFEVVRKLTRWSLEGVLNDFVKAAPARMQSDAALNLGVTLTLHCRAARQGPATRADQAPGPSRLRKPSSIASLWRERGLGLTKGVRGRRGGANPIPRLRRGGRGQAYANVQRLPCSEVLQCRSPRDGFEKSRIGRESDYGAAQGYLRSAQQVARGRQRRCGA